MPIHGYPGGVITANPVAPTSTVATGVWTTEQQLQATASGNWPRPGPAQPISRSLRFNSADSTYLNRTPASAGNRKTWTWSGWVKRSTLGTVQGIFDAYVGGNDFATAFFNSDNTIYFYTCTSGPFIDYDFTTTAVFRDASAWYHIVLVLDTSNATQADRFIVYVNGVRQAGTNPSGAFDLNVETYINSTASHRLGQRVDGSYYFNGYMTEVYFIGGSALTPSSFGQTNTATGVWEPISYTGSYSGTNSFYLNFSDNSGTTSTTLGKDSSGNGNNWTPNNFSVTAGAGNDSMVDSPTSYGTDTGAGGEVRGNYCTLNPLWKGANITMSNGNLDATMSAASDASFMSTITMTSGKWYWEVLLNSVSTDYPYIGVATPNFNYQAVGASCIRSSATGFFKASNANKWNLSSSAYGSSFANGDIMMIAYDADNAKIYFGKNGTWDASSDPATGANPAFTGVNAPVTPAGFVYNCSWTMNFGQRAFAYTAPSGFKALCTQNLPTPTIGATSTTQANDYMNVVLYTGDGANPRTVSGVGFQPDFVWTKSRSSAFDHWLFDAVRGATKTLTSNSTSAEITYANSLKSFISDGFTVGDLSDINANGGSYVAWNWKANGAGSSNTAGTITSTVSASTTSGFSIVTYTGTGANATVGHGLGVAPAMYIVKRRTGGIGNWAVWHTSLSNTTTSYILLDSTAAQSTSTSLWGSTAATSTTLGLGTSVTTNNSSDTYVAYCFAAVAGYSAFGSYTGNGSTDGPFVYSGFRPRYLLTKEVSASGNEWFIWDSARNPYNQMDNELFANSAAAENSTAWTYQPYIDFLSNGFKLRSVNTHINGSGSTLIYAAFAENPFKYSLAR